MTTAQNSTLSVNTTRITAPRNSTLVRFLAGGRYGFVGGPCVSFNDISVSGISDDSSLHSIRVSTPGTSFGMQLSYLLKNGSIIQGPERGIFSGNVGTFTLVSGEKIIRVKGRSNSVIVALQFATDQNRSSAVFGGAGGNEFEEHSPGYALHAVSGCAKSSALEIQFHWILIR
jgi:hypothetical protein